MKIGTGMTLVDAISVSVYGSADRPRPKPKRGDAICPRVWSPHRHPLITPVHSVPEPVDRIVRCFTRVTQEVREGVLTLTKDLKHLPCQDHLVPQCAP